MFLIYEENENKYLLKPFTINDNKFRKTDLLYYIKHNKPVFITGYNVKGYHVDGIVMNIT